jgi:hypothetical protein
MGGNGGLIDTFSKGNTVAKMQAEMLLGNVATKDRYTEKYSSFYGGSFMGHTFVDATLIYVPKTEMVLCKKNRKQANTFLAQKTNKIKKLEAKNESLENQLVVEKQNTSVALAQAQQSAIFFDQVLNKPVVKKIEKLNLEREHGQPAKYYPENLRSKLSITSTNETNTAVKNWQKINTNTREHGQPAKYYPENLRSKLSITSLSITSTNETNTAVKNWQMINTKK